jgi:hypothetical protein
MDEVIRESVKQGVVIEINSNPRSWSSTGAS